MAFIRIAAAAAMLLAPCAWADPGAVPARLNLELPAAYRAVAEPDADCMCASARPYHAALEKARQAYEIKPSNDPWLGNIVRGAACAIGHGRYC
jgi:hypothetical protein